MTERKSSEKIISLHLVALSIVLILGGINRLAPWFRSPFLGCEFFLVRDVISIFGITPLIALILWNLNYILQPANRIAQAIFLFFIVIFSVSMGAHDVTNTLGMARDIVPLKVFMTMDFVDNKLTHDTFFASFAGMTVVLLIGQVGNPLEKPMSVSSLVFALASAAMVGLVIFANMAFEKTGVDIIVGLSIQVIGILLWLKKRKSILCLPIVMFFLVSFSLGFIGASLFKLISR